jgi:hypothetical protein
VAGKAVSASVNAHDGAVTTLFLPGNRRLGMKATFTQDDGARIADQFIGMHQIDASGLEKTVSLLDNGDTKTWTVTWQGHEGVVKVPVYFEVDVDAASGLVFGYASIDRPYSIPGPPKISQVEAEQAARSVAGTPDAQVDSVELQLAFTDAGTQYLVYVIQLSSPVEGQPSSLRIYAWVQVDATTGEAKVVAVG